MLELTYGKSIDYYRDMAQRAGIPRRMVPGVYRWVEVGRYPGGFLTSVLANNLRLAVAYADDENIRLLPNWIQFCTWCIPGHFNHSL